MKIEFRNINGQKTSLDSRLTISDLARMGIEVHLQPRNKPKSKDPHWFYHDPKNRRAKDGREK